MDADFRKEVRFEPELLQLTDELYRVAVGLFWSLAGGSELAKQVGHSLMQLVRAS
jgi:hypothetical protein